MDESVAQVITPSQPVTVNEISPEIHALFNQIAEKIIEQQEAIIGPIAVDRAKKVAYLDVDWPQHAVGVSGNPKEVIDSLVAQYKELFGQIAVETCKDTVGRYIAQLPDDQKPVSLL